ncbi:mucin-5AC-like isoform X2 [Planococcus citri]|uniref:mucin-5AC-like isoform X2 n=1 Tax=Planococcus citri TaxID=170843 RepID=UPI0031F7C0F2
MVFLSEMATAWRLYLSFGVILIFSECGFTEVTSNDLAKKNDATNSSGSTERNVSSSSAATTTKLSKHSTATMNTLKTSTSLPLSGGLEMLDSESFTSRITSSATESVSAATNTTIVVVAAAAAEATTMTGNLYQSNVSRQINAYTTPTTPSISQWKQNVTETSSATGKDEKENQYISFRNLDDAFKNVKKSTKKSIENQFSSGGFVSSAGTVVAGSTYNNDTLKEANISSQNAHKTLTLSTQPIKNDSSVRKWKLSTTKLANSTPSSELFFSISRTVTSPPTSTSVEMFSQTTSAATTKPSSIEIQSQVTVPASAEIDSGEVNNNIGSNDETLQNSTSPFDINSLRKKFFYIGNLTSNNTTEKNFPSTVPLDDASSSSSSSQPSPPPSSYTWKGQEDKSQNVARTKTLTAVGDFTPDNTSVVAVTERTQQLAANAENNLTTRLTVPQTRLINISSAVMGDNYASTELSTNYSIPYVNTSISVTAVPHLKNFTVNATKTNVTHSINKEHLMFPGITLKVSHMLIPKQKRSRYNIQNMRIELPKSELLNKPSAPAPKNSNCTRFPIQVVTASDTETKEKVNLTEEHYDCEYSTPELNNTQKEPVVSLHTYFGGYVFRYAVPKQANVSVSNQTANDTVHSTIAPSPDDNDDYYSSYMEYSDTTNGSNNSEVEDGIFPDPDMSKIVSKTKTEALSVPVADTSITDSDLHDHDVIDSVMYIYFGGTTHGQRGAGRQIIIVGAVIALVAQFLTLASSIRRIKTHHGEEPTIILLNIETALTLTNLTFILGVQSTSDHTICKITAVSLYYLHIAALFWFLLSSLYSVQTVCQINKPFKFYTLCTVGWILPFFTTLLSYAFNERSFETNLYCWVSPLRGILISYISPVILLCIICIVLTIIGLRNVTETTEDFDDTYSHKKLLRISAVALPLFSLIWFTGMVSLENSASLLFSLIFLIADTVLNWLLFACWLPSEASQWKDMDDDYYDEEEDFDDEPVLVKRRFDDQPLLSELYEYGAQGQLYNLRVEPISIISTS